MKTIAIILFCAVILLLWLIANAMSKPVFNKMSKTLNLIVSEIQLQTIVYL